MKAILISIRPQHTCNILNGIKWWEIRKKFPKDYVGWVYIYCTAEDKNGYLIRNRSTKKCEFTYNGFVKSVCWSANRKVVARFWCDKVEGVWKTTTNIWTYGSDLEPNFYKESCLNDIELDRYFKPTKVGFGKVYGYAIHIIKLEIFDKPKEISEFSIKKCKTCIANDGGCYLKNECQELPLTRAPQSWCYVEAL